MAEENQIERMQYLLETLTAELEELRQTVKQLVRKPCVGCGDTFAPPEVQTLVCPSNIYKKRLCCALCGAWMSDRWTIYN